MESFPINDEFYELELIFKLTINIPASFKILCLIDLYFKDDRSSFNNLSHLRKVKDEFALSTIKVSFTVFSSHSKSVTKMPTIWPPTGRPTFRVVLAVRRPGRSLAQAWAGLRWSLLPGRKVSYPEVSDSGSAAQPGAAGHAVFYWLGFQCSKPCFSFPNINSETTATKTATMCSVLST